jgi:hypothetical protein
MLISAPAKIRIPGLTRLDQAELADSADSVSIEFENEALPDGRFGELMTVALIAVTFAGMKVLAAYLLRTSEGQNIKKTIEIVNADGSTRTEIIEVNLRSSKAPKADILKAISTALHIDLSQFAGS